MNSIFRGLYKTCACGCGYLIKILNRDNNFRNYKQGHNHYGKKGPQSANWQGGRIKRRLYWYLYIPDYFSLTKQGYVAEHIYFYQEYYKCCKLPWEDIHHIDPVTEDYCNNMIWNLQGLTIVQHCKITENNKYEKKDMSNRFCIDCGSNQTYMRKYKDIVRASWTGDEKNGFICNTCQARRYRKRNKLNR